MKRRPLTTAVVLSGVVAVGCGSASDPDGGSSEEAGGGDDTIVVWDWKSGEENAASYFEAAEADFNEANPDATIDFVSQPFDEYYTLLGAAQQSGSGPDVMLFNGGGEIRSRTDSLLPLDDYIGDDADRLTGWEAFADDEATYGYPVTLQGHPIYYNRALHEEAGLDPDSPAESWEALQEDCTTLKEETDVSCFSVGNQEGTGIQFFLSVFGTGVLSPETYDAWIEGDRDWTSPEVKRIFELWVEAEESGMNSDAPNSTTLFNDAFNQFSAGRAAHVLGLMSDIGHWQDFEDFMAPEDIGVMNSPKIMDDAEPVFPYDGGIGYAVSAETENPELAVEAVRSLTSAEALENFYRDGGAITSDTGISVEGDGPAVETIVGELEGGKPALHVALSSETLELMGRLSQELLSGSVTVDDAMEQLAASDDGQG